MVNRRHRRANPESTGAHGSPEAPHIPKLRADAKRQVIADEQFRTVQEEDQQNNELLDLSRQILALTKEVRALAGRDDGRKP